VLAENARQFIGAILSKTSVDPPAEITKLEVKKQYQAIDILVLINAKIALVIEDKVHTENHSDQLRRYQTLVKKEYPDHHIACIYLKTGDQSSYHKVEEREFAAFPRSELLEVLRQGKESKVGNHIFLDFLNHLEAIDESVNQYRSMPLDKWDWQCWTGFFTELRKQLADGDWGYVANPSGGFMGFWWHSQEGKFLLIEGQFDAKNPSRLCFKIEVEEKNEQSVQRNDWYDTLRNAATELDFALSKPKRFGKGTYMTAAIADEEFRKTDAQGVIDMQATVAFLRQAEEFMDRVIGKNVSEGSAE